MMGDTEFADALHGDESRGGKEGTRDDDGGDRLGFAVAVGVVVVGGKGGDFESGPDDEGAEDSTRHEEAVRCQFKSLRISGREKQAAGGV